MMIEAAFEPLPLRRRTIVPVNPELYRIVSARGESREVQASTAYEAFKLSGFQEAIRIERTATMRLQVLPRSRFADEKSEVAPAQQEIAPPVYRRKSPVVSADDLDSLMKALHHVAEDMHSSPQAHEREQPVTTPMGVEVHGDGFDELIPAAMTPSQMGVVKQAVEPELPSTASGTPREIIPDQELTPEEVDKLLKG